MKQSIPKAGKVKALMIDVETLRNLMDLASLASFGNLMKSCPGGRLIADGYMCLHCGKDPSNVIEKNGKKYRQCGAQFKDTLPQSQDDVYRALPMMDLE